MVVGGAEVGEGGSSEHEVGVAVQYLKMYGAEIRNRKECDWISRGALNKFETVFLVCWQPK